MCCFLQFFVFSNAQSLGFSGGVLRNNFFDVSPGIHHDFYDYQLFSGFGNTFAFTLDFVEIWPLPMRFAIQVDNYQGEIIVQGFTPKGFFYVNAEVEKRIIAATVFPINLDLFRYLNINLGIQMNFLIHAKTKGTKSVTNNTPGAQITYFSGGGAEINTKFNTGVVARIGWDLAISKEWTLVPQYQYYLGLSNDFKGIYGYNIKSMRHYLGIEVVRSL